MVEIGLPPLWSAGRWVPAGRWVSAGSVLGSPGKAELSHRIHLQPLTTVVFALLRPHSMGSVFDLCFEMAWVGQLPSLFSGRWVFVGSVRGTPGKDERLDRNHLQPLAIAVFALSRLFSTGSVSDLCFGLAIASGLRPFYIARRRTHTAPLVM